jgi:hypothetical protein
MNAPETALPLQPGPPGVTSDIPLFPRAGGVVVFFSITTARQGRSVFLPRTAVSLERRAYAAACSFCSRCHRRSRFEQTSASLRAAATQAILALERLRIRV